MSSEKMCLVHLALFLAVPVIVFAQGIDGDYQALMAFKSTADVVQKLSSWNDRKPCAGGWYGVSCQYGRVSRLVLEGLQLAGKIDSLTALDQLRVLSLKGNMLNDSLPDLSNWKYLKFLYLTQNQFSGQLPGSIYALVRLYRLDLSHNKLVGNIPVSFNSLPNLLTLRLENNNLSGSIPRLNLSNLQDFNVSGNRLTGPIPSSLSKFPMSAFLGNVELCGTPFLACITSQPSSPEMTNPLIVPSTPSSKPAPSYAKKGPNKLSKGAIIAIVVGDFAFLMVITSFFLLYYWKKYSHSSAGKHYRRSESEKLVFSSGQYPVHASEADRGKLSFMDGRKQFDLEDLLRASAEMLGKGSFGTAYKAVLEDCSVVAVKRLKDVNSQGRREFEQHMELIGKLRHPNLVCLRAYYYARDEKLLVYDYLSNGSLYSLLHGNRGPGRTPLDWTTRVKIALGAARGLAYLHHECKSPKIPHGNIKSSNVLVDKNGNACISDFGLAVMASSAVVASRLAGYKAPEHAETKKVSQRGDVYSFGVLLLEILTGKAPAAPSHAQDDIIDLPKWVQSVVQEEWTAEVFDLELMRYKNIEEEMVAMLQIAMVCVSQSPKLRPKMSQVVKMIEDIGGYQSPQRSDSFDSMSHSPSISEDTGTSH